MSQENVEVVRLAYEVAYQERSVDGVRDRFAPDFCFHMRPGWPGRTAYFTDSMTELWADLDETYDEFTLVPERFEVIEGYVLVSIHQTTKLPGSDDRLESRIFHLWRVEDAVPREAWTFADRAEALEAAGLRE